MTAKCGNKKCGRQFTKKQRTQLYCSKRCGITVRQRTRYEKYFRSLGLKRKRGQQVHRVQDYSLEEGCALTCPSTHPTLESWPDEGNMTIGIGVLCERGDCIVVASDMRATYGTSRVGPNDECGKQFQLKPFKCMTCVAGTMSDSHAVISQLSWNVKKLRGRKLIERERLMDLIDEARARQLFRVYDWALKRNMGVSLLEWKQGRLPGARKLDDLVLRAGYSFMRNTPFRVELIVAGFIGEQTMFFRACQKNKIEEESSPGVYAIGSGQRRAIRALNRRGQNYAMSLPRTLLHVHEAMIASRRDKKVGKCTGYMVIRKRVPQILFLKTDSPALENWRKAYEHRPFTHSLDDSRIAGLDIYQQLKFLRPMKG